MVTGLGAGFLPVAPGTWGSLEALLPAALLHLVLPGRERLALGALVCLLLAPAILWSGRVAARAGETDPSMVVIDEILGQWVALLLTSISWSGLIASFLLFRLMDILKPFPAGRSERLPGGWGIVADDLIAGLYAGLALLGLNWFWGA